jgi:hypothetical protein
MPKIIVLEQALILPAIDIVAMLQGQLISAIPRVQIPNGLSFLLAPEQSSSQIKLSEKYRSPFLSLAEMACHTNKDGTTRLEAWATCEKTKMIHDVEQFATLSSLTIWTQSYLEELLKEQGHLFLTYLKVHRLPSKITIPSEKISIGKTGKFVGLLSMECDSAQVTESLPILSDRLFEQRKQKLEDFMPPGCSELEFLKSTVEHYAKNNPEAKKLDNEIRIFLGWADSQKIALTPDWIKEITTAGNSSNGDLFEKRVRQAFIYLGFTNTRNDPKASLNPESSGGSGGLDFYCEFPYPIVGECKASKDLKVNDNKNGAPAQLIKLGHKNLFNSEEFSCAIKIIVAPGELTKSAEKTTIGNQMNIMRPETLQRLVELNMTHPGSIDLLKLKSCLESIPFGTDADNKVNDFIGQIEKTIKLRSHVVKTFKEYLEKTKVSESGIEKFSGFFSGSNSPETLKDRELYNILIELSSPLSGYLGRKQCDEDWKGDRFYYLRDLILPTT